MIFDGVYVCNNCLPKLKEQWMKEKQRKDTVSGGVTVAIGGGGHAHAEHAHASVSVSAHGHGGHAHAEHGHSGTISVSIHLLS